MKHGQLGIGMALGALALVACLRATPACAAPERQAEATSSFCAVVGGTEANKNDMVTFFYKRAGVGTPADPAERITMAVYKAAPGNVNEPRMRLHTVRELTWDLKLMDFNGSPAADHPSVQDVGGALNKK